MIACFISNEGMLRAAIAIELVREGRKRQFPFDCISWMVCPWWRRVVRNAASSVEDEEGQDVCFLGLDLLDLDLDFCLAMEP